MSAVLREMTPLTWALFGVLFLTALLLFGCVAVGATLWIRGFRADSEDMRGSGGHKLDTAVSIRDLPVPDGPAPGACGPERAR